MPRTRQPELFEAETQSDLFGAEATPTYRPDPDKVRARLPSFPLQLATPQ